MGKTKNAGREGLSFFKFCMNETTKNSKKINNNDSRPYWWVL
jgi:hypothetical protein